MGTLKEQVWFGAAIYAASGASMLIPMFLAVPATIFIAASTLEQFKSGNLVSAISCTQQHTFGALR